MSSFLTEGGWLLIADLEMLGIVMVLCAAVLLPCGMCFLVKKARKGRCDTLKGKSDRCPCGKRDD